MTGVDTRWISWICQKGITESIARIISRAEGKGIKVKKQQWNRELLPMMQLKAWTMAEYSARAIEEEGSLESGWRKKEGMCRNKALDCITQGMYWYVVEHNSWVTSVSVAGLKVLVSVATWLRMKSALQTVTVTVTGYAGNQSMLLEKHPKCLPIYMKWSGCFRFQCNYIYFPWP